MKNVRIDRFCKKTDILKFERSYVLDPREPVTPFRIKSIILLKKYFPKSPKQWKSYTKAITTLPYNV